jgi:hypothetical protein
VSIVQQGDEYLPGGQPACNLCGAPVVPPFLWWRGDVADLFVCLDCGGHGRAIALDFIQLEAISHMRNVAPESYASRITLVREFFRDR